MAGMPESLAGKATRRELKRVMSAAGWTASVTATELGVSRRQVQRWLAGDEMPTKKLALLAQKSGRPVKLEFGAQEEAPALTAGAEVLVGGLKIRMMPVVTGGLAGPLELQALALVVEELRRDGLLVGEVLPEESAKPRGIANTAAKRSR